MDDSTCRELHDRATRGESLTADEARELEQWYALNDAAEQAVLNGNLASRSESRHADVDGMIARIQETAQRVAVLSHENGAIRSEIATLYRRLPTTVSVHRC